jgi:predicted dehydrogenase
VVGCGLVAQVMHLHYLRELRDRFEIAAICDLSPTVLERMGQEYGVERRFSDWRALLAEPLDAVMVLTSGSHEPIAVAAADARRHVFIEKPIALSEAEGQQIMAAGRRAGVHLMVGYMKRYDPAVERMRDELAAFTELRAVTTATLESSWRWYVRHYPVVTAADADPATLQALQADDDERVSRAIPTKDPVLRRGYRRFLVDSMVHDLNLVRGLLGEPDALDYARLSESGVTAVLGFGPVACSMRWVNLQDGMARYRQEFAFFSPQRRATLVFPSPFLRSMPTELVLEGGASETLRSWRTVETVSYEEAFKRELLEFYECVTADREPRTTAADAVRDVAICQAMVAAHLDGQRRPLTSPPVPTR